MGTCHHHHLTQLWCQQQYAAQKVSWISPAWLHNLSSLGFVLDDFYYFREACIKGQLWVVYELWKWLQLKYQTWTTLRGLTFGVWWILHSLSTGFYWHFTPNISVFLQVEVSTWILFKHCLLKVPWKFLVSHLGASPKRRAWILQTSGLKQASNLSWQTNSFPCLDCELFKGSLYYLRFLQNLARMHHESEPFSILVVNPNPTISN